MYTYILLYNVDPNFQSIFMIGKIQFATSHLCPKSSPLFPHKCHRKCMPPKGAFLMLQVSENGFADQHNSSV